MIKHGETGSADRYMEPLKGNLLSGRKTISPKTDTRRHRVKFFYSPLTALIVFVLSFAVGRVSLSETASIALAELHGIPIFSQMEHLIRSPDRQLIGEKEDRINVLLLGMGGEGHDGPYLTDTIIVASIRPSESRVALLSIPRDLIVLLPEYGWRKINATNAFGELEARGRGGDFTRTAVEGLLGIDIPYYVRIDFGGFTQIIDSMGGVNIYVERAFTDYTYPTDDYLTQVVSFEQGWQKMGGDTALKYARSRHGTNGESSDFARAERQQKVLSAVKDKMLSLRTYRNPAVISNTLASLQSNVATNLKIGDLLRIVKMAQQLNDVTVMHKVIDNGPDSPLTSSFINGAYVLVPKNGDWSALRDVALNIFSEAEVVEETPGQKDIPAGNMTKIEMQNGSGVTGLARETAEKLKNLGFNIVKIGNADSFSYETTTIYDLTNGKDKVSLAKLKQGLPSADVASRIPKGIRESVGSGADFLVILGSDGSGE